MRKTTRIALATVAVCALGLPALGNGKPVERPFWGIATVTWTLDMTTGEATGYETGVGTHLGLYVNESPIFQLRTYWSS